MPFAEEFDKVWGIFKEWIQSAVKNLEINVIRADEIKRAGVVVEDMLNNMHESVFCVVDISHHNPNVMWEAGYMAALGKPIIYLSQSLENVPFDIQHQRIIKYNREEMNLELKEEIQTYIQETLKYQGLMDEDFRNFYISTNMFQKTIAVTGSMDASSSVRQTITSTLSLFLGKKIRWLCGSWGETDEHIVRFLSGHKEDVQVVGYNQLDLSASISELVSERKIPFMDGLSEKMPKIIEKLPMPHRDRIFLMKADIIILFWANQSPGTAHMISRFMDQEKNVFVVHI